MPLPGLRHASVGRLKAASGIRGRDALREGGESGSLGGGSGADEEFLSRDPGRKIPATVFVGEDGH